MADRILVSTEDMRTTISEYTSQKAKLMEAIGICNKASTLLAQSWAGPSFAACCAKMANTYKNLFQCEQKIDDAISELNKVCTIMEQAEGKVSQSAAALDVGSSPFA